jgi:Ca2+-binding RTX toxin-like protein
MTMCTQARRLRRERLTWSILLAAMALTCLPLASARAAEIAVTNGVLTISDTVGENNVIDVLPSSMTDYIVIDQGAAFVAGPGCTAVFPPIVQCSFVLSIAVDAGAGDDTIGLQGVMVPVRAAGQAGDDLLEAGAGKAVMDGGDGIDSVVGGAAVDDLSGGGGPDLLIGGASADAMHGNTGDDILEGKGNGADVLDGDAGRDLLRAGSGNDTLSGGTGDDVLVSGAGSDSVTTGRGSDEVFGVGSGDKLHCTADDQVVLQPGSGARQAGCARPDNVVTASASSGPPTRWPPESAQGAQAALVRPDPQIESKLRLPGDAKRFTVKIPETADYDLRVRVRVLDASRKNIRSPFIRKVRTMHKSTYPLPLAARKRRTAAYVVVQRLRGD